MEPQSLETPKEGEVLGQHCGFKGQDESVWLVHKGEQLKTITVPLFHILK